MKIRVQQGAVVILMVWMIGCGSAEPESRSEVWDSAGIQISFSDLSTGDPAPSCEIGDLPSLRIGASHSQGGDLLFKVEDVLGYPDGSVAVLNRGTQEVRVFAEDGEFRFSVGGDGEGPGEFRDPIQFGLLYPDSLIVWDWGLLRLSVFDSNGSFVRSTPLSPSVLNPTGEFEVYGCPPGILIADHDFRTFEGSEFAPQYMNLLRYSLEGGLTDTVGILPYGSMGWVNQETRQGGRRLFESLGTFAVAGDMLFLSEGSRPEVEVRREDGNLIRIIRWLPPDRVVRTTDLEAYQAQRLAGVEGGMRQAIRRSFEVVPVSDSFPAVRGLRVDPDGGLWVRTYRPPTSDLEEWWAFDPGGRFHCQLSLPAGLTVFEIGRDYLLGKTENELGVEFVEKHRLSLKKLPGVSNGG